MVAIFGKTTWLGTLKSAEAYSEPSQTSNMEHFAKIINGFQALAILAKISIFDV